MYLTYEEYVDLGGQLDESTFKHLEFEARARIDWVTFNRLADETNIPLKVKECMYYIINLLNNKFDAINSFNNGDSSTSKASIKSRSNDGVSTSYNNLDAKDVVNLADNEINSLIQRSLQGVTNSLGRKLLYRGLYKGE